MTDTYTFDDFRESTVPWDMVPPIPPALSLASENNDDVTLSIIHKLDGYGRIKVAVIGIEELCGLKLYETLRHKKDFYVTGFSTYSSIENINIFDVVIYMRGGIGDFKDYNSMNRSRAYDELVLDPLRVVERMSASQMFIFTSTARIAEGAGDQLFYESDAPSNWLLDRHAEFLRRREYALQLYVGSVISAPVLIGLRVGLMLDTEPNLFLETKAEVHVSSFPYEMLRDAYVKGHVTIENSDSFRSLLSFTDLSRAVVAIINNPYALTLRYEVFHLQSSYGTVESIAHDLSALTGVHSTIVKDESCNEDVCKSSAGFSLDTAKFERTFEFRFHDTTQSMLTAIIAHIPVSIEKYVNTEFFLRDYVNEENAESGSHTTCPVCGSSHEKHFHVLHVGDRTPSPLHHHQNATQHSVNLWRCELCNHVFVSSSSTTASGNYSYLNEHGTYIVDRLKNTHLDLDRELSDIVVRNTLRDWSLLRPANVIEILQSFPTKISDSNVVASLWKKHFGSLGWNISSDSMSGLKGSKSYQELMNGDHRNVDVIISVLTPEHLDDPLKFLMACSAAMLKSSKLFLLLSHFDIIENDEVLPLFDHSRKHFFTIHSLYLLAKFSNLRVTEMHKLHHDTVGKKKTAYRLFTLQLIDHSEGVEDDDGPILVDMQSSVISGQLTNLYYSRYTENVNRCRSWVVKKLRKLVEKNYNIFSYGEYHFLLRHIFSGNGAQHSHFISAVLSEENENDNHIPGLNIPIVPMNDLLQKPNVYMKSQKVVLFLTTPLENGELQILLSRMSGILNGVLVLSFYPIPKVVRYSRTLGQNSNDMTAVTLSRFHPLAFPTPQPSIPRPKRILITHFYNEEFLLPFWIRHHARMFDSAILIDYYSDDKSVEIIRRLAPSTWRVVKTRNKAWEAEEIDREVMWYENQHPRDWKIALCLTEFLISPNFGQILHKYSSNAKSRGNPHHESVVYSIPTVSVFGDDAVPLELDKSLVEQRAVYGHHDESKVTGIESVSRKLIDTSPETSMYHRYVHKGVTEKQMQYNFGRHFISHLDGSTIDPECSPWVKQLNDTFIMKYTWSPWPDTKQRKLKLEQKRVQDISLLPNEQWGYYMSLLLSSETIDIARNLVLSGVKLFDMHDMEDISPDHNVPVNEIFLRSLNPRYS